MSNPNGEALAILEGMAVICDCDHDAPVSSPDGHEDACEVQSAYSDALGAVMAAPVLAAEAAGRAELLREELVYGPFDGDDIDWLD